MAAQRLYPDIKFRFSYSVSRSIFAHVEIGNKVITTQVVEEIYQEMKKIADNDYIFERVIISNEEAAKLYEEFKLYDKLAVLQYRPEKTVHLYKADNYFNYMYGKMVPSTGYLKNFKLIFYPPGILIQYPRHEFNGEIPPFKDEPIFQNTLEGSDAWSSLVHLSTIAEINDYSKESEGTNLINICENKHNRMLAELGQIIQDRINNIKLICIAGPSSSGKTTFADRLTLELISRGIKPIRISIDDYYKTRENVPLDEDGNKDFESIDALDIDLFNKNLLSLLSGEEVLLPTFDFKTNSRNFNRKIKIGPKDPIIIEGIHALNEAMTPLIPKHIKYKIYISPQAQINLDYENPISISDIRLLRRIVRDSKYRNSSAEETISMWPSVRRGEEKYIFPFQDDADFTFNSALIYEIGVLKTYVEPLLYSVPQDSPYYEEAKRLINFLRLFLPIPADVVPQDSILREFIGGSCFHE